MNFLADIYIKHLKEILDPQGKAAKLGLKNLGLSVMGDIRIEKTYYS